MSDLLRVVGLNPFRSILSSFQISMVMKVSKLKPICTVFARTLLAGQILPAATIRNTAVLGRDHYTEVQYLVKNARRARNWPLWAGDLYTEVIVKAGLTVYV